MQKLLLATLCTGLLASAAYAEDRPDHFEGKAANTLSEAVTNVSEANGRLAKLLDQDELTDNDFATIHELSYTLENALEKIEDELDSIAEDLEEVHQGSETNEPERVRTHGAAYLEAARTLTK
ncbi:DUF6746 family protein [Halomonas sp. GXIMD04776]|uniref:DUF6746 family protein n=1 Tax=Halomonas sp. GXIMD04776 TaxID=3415605 RepID=UPI003CBFCA6A